MKFKTRGLAVGLVATVAMSLAAPSYAGYSEGHIGCQTGYDPGTLSGSSTNNWHHHWFEGAGTLDEYNDYVGHYWTSVSNGDWSVEVDSMTSGYAWCG